GPITVATTSDAREGEADRTSLSTAISRGRLSGIINSSMVTSRRPRHSECSRNYYNFSLGTSRALAEKRRTLPFAEARPQEEPDGKPHRGGTQFLRRVVQQYGSSRAGGILHRGRRLSQHPAGAGHRQGGHR